MEDVSKYPALLQRLLVEGWPEQHVAKVAGGNFLRVMRQVEQVRILETKDGDHFLLVMRPVKQGRHMVRVARDTFLAVYGRRSS